MGKLNLSSSRLAKPHRPDAGRVFLNHCANNDKHKNPVRFRWRRESSAPLMIPLNCTLPDDSRVRQKRLFSSPIFELQNGGG
jgi:hypothetical protein